MGCGNSTTTSTTKANPYAEQAYKSLIGQAQGIASKPYTPYSAPRVAGFTGDQEAAFQGLRDAQGIWTPYLNAASQYAAQGAEGTAGALEDFNSDNLQKYMNPATQGLIDATMANIQRSNAVQQNDLVGKAISSGASPFGGDRAGVAAAELARNQALAGNQTIAGLQSDAYNSAVSQFNAHNQARQQALQGDRSASANAASQYAGLGTTAQNAAMQGASGLLTAGSAQQALAQQQLDVPYQDYMNRQAYPYNQLSWLSGIVGGIAPGLGGTSTGTTPSQGVGSQLLGLGTAALGFFSDERVKEDIEPVGELDNGETVYRYRYKGDPRFQIGLIAQEVAEGHPDAVGDMGGGILGVDYRKATEKRADGGAIDFTKLNPFGIQMAQIGDTSPQVAKPPSANASSSGGIGAQDMMGLGSALKGAIGNLGFTGGNVPGYFGNSGYVNNLSFGGPRADGGIVESYAEGGIVPPMIDPSMFAYRPSGVGATNGSYGVPYLNALPQITFPEAQPVQAAPAPQSWQNHPIAQAVKKWRNPVNDSKRAAGGIVDPYDTEDDPADAPWLEAGDEGAYAPAGIEPVSPTGGIMSGISDYFDRSKPAPTGIGGRGLLFGEGPNLPLLTAGAAMLASRSPNVGTALGEGILAGASQYQRAKERTAQLDGKPMVLTDGPTIRLFYPSDGRSIDTGVPNYKYKSDSKPKVSLSPVYGTKDGKTVLLQPNDAGELVQSQIPEGVEISSGVDKVDLGTQWGIIDKRTGQIVGYQPKDIAGEKAAEAEGKAKGEATAALPGAITSAETAIKTINDLRNHPGREFGTGMSSVFSDWVPGTSGRDFSVMNNQAKGQTFLQAYNALKGTGAISEAEGAKAEAAIGRLDPSQSEEGYLTALKDLEDVVKKGLETAKAKASLPSSEIASTPEAAGLPKPRTRAEIEALPSGSKFIWSGKVETRK